MQCASSSRRYALGRVIESPDVLGRLTDERRVMPVGE